MYMKTVRLSNPADATIKKFQMSYDIISIKETFDFFDFCEFFSLLHAKTFDFAERAFSEIV